MKTTVNLSDFRSSFENMNRKENFSYSGLESLFDCFEEYEQSTGEEIELDVIAICCEYTEYENIEEFWKNYDKEDYPTIEDIENNTQVIRIDNESFIIQNF